MTVKILTEEQVYKPVKVEITFETKEQLQTFVDLYGNGGTVHNSLSDKLKRVTVRGIKIIDMETWEKLSDLAA